ncbi:M20/M25/M40 family metallo-hydrolase [Terriglobus roseus]|uniref:Putative aminopeptidase FrvX n=1 Tax=Terriglobus roseus TaxID=392734 RepID=A0A1H4SKX9_9BACT|nr:M28 family peptidase [Terriglobus roseus]SEC44855.1 Putative aminopeptidase FrvX [Terriglobus roseus]
MHALPIRFVSLLIALAGINHAVAQVRSTTDDLTWLTNTAAVSGYESALSARIADVLKDMRPQRDAMGNVSVTFGSGSPHRLIAAPIDEPGYVVSHIEPDGYLRVQRLPQAGMPPHYNEMQNAQQMLVTTSNGTSLPVVVAALSIHLTPGRANVPDPDDIDNMYVDIGAKSSADVLRSGVEVLSPLAADRTVMRVGPHDWVGTAIGDRFGAALLLQLARALAAKPGTGTTTIAFVTQQYAGSRGLTRVLQTTQPDELIYVGRGRPEPKSVLTPAILGSGAIAFTSNVDATASNWFGSAPLQHTGAASFLIKGYGPAFPLPAHTLHLGLPLQYPLTAGEMLDERDLYALQTDLFRYAGASFSAPPSMAPTATAYPQAAAKLSVKPEIGAVLKTLTETYGVSEVERMPREAVERLLPPWVKTETDAAGNLIVRFGKGEKPAAVFMAHTDELGFRIKSISADGTLELDNKGGGSPAFFWGHPALVHTSAGMLGAVVTLPDSFDTSQFHFPSDFRIAAKLNVGASSSAEAASLGIKVGDFVTIPKRLRTLQDGRVSVRSLDDRVGCTAMIEAVWALGKDFNRDVTFVWSTQEELGLLGATAFAGKANETKKVPETVFAIDTFVSSDTPLESHRFADGKLGEGFVIRAIDNSNIVPLSAVQRVRIIAGKHSIPVQYGVTGGGNDGAAFVRYGTTDVALSWPLRYAHSPAEVVDMRDVVALTDIVTALAKEW